MTTEQITQQFLQAVETIVDGKISSVKYDQTYIMKIKDISKKSEGKYLVSNDSMQFTAKIRDEDFTTYYGKGDQVYVLIPQGDFNNDKIILGRVANSQLDEYFTYRKPFERLYDMISIDQEDSDDNNFILDNGNPPNPAGGVLDFTHGGPVDRDSLEYPFAKDDNELILGYWMDNTGQKCSSFFDTYGFSFVVQTIGDMPPMEEMNYGIKYYITYTDRSQEIIVYDAKYTMDGNMQYFILPYKQQHLYNNLNDKCIQAIVATGFWNYEEGYSDLTHKDWKIIFKNLKFVNGYKIDSYSRDLVRIYSVGSNLYESGKDTTRITKLIWAKYNKDENRFYMYTPSPEEKVTIYWQKSNTIINDKASLTEVSNWSSISAYNNQYMAKIPMNVGLPNTYVRVLFQVGTTSYDVPVIKFKSGAEGSQSGGEEFPEDVLISFKFQKLDTDGETWITDTNNHYLYNSSSVLRNPAEKDIDRRVVALVDGRVETDNAHFIWTIPEDLENTMLVFPSFDESTADSPMLPYRIKEKYVSGLNNKISCRVLYNGLIYDKTVEFNFGYPEYLNGYCRFEISTGLDDKTEISVIDVLKRGSACAQVDPAVNEFKFDVFARLIGEQSRTNFSYVLKETSQFGAQWQVFGVNTDGTINTRVAGVSVESYSWDEYVEAFKARIKINRESFDIRRGFGIKCTTDFSIPGYDSQTLVSYLSIPTIKDDTIIGINGPTYAKVNDNTLIPESDNPLSLAFGFDYRPASYGSYSFLGLSYYNDSSFKDIFEEVQDGSLYNKKYKFKADWVPYIDEEKGVRVDTLCYSRVGSQDALFSEIFFFFKGRDKFARTTPISVSQYTNEDLNALFPEDSENQNIYNLYTAIKGLTPEQKAALRELLLQE